MTKIRVETNGAPAAIGPYAQGVKAQGTLVFVSGQLPIDPATGVFAGSDIESQTHQSLKNVLAVVAAAGGNAKSIVKTTVFLKDMNEFAAMNQAYATYFSEDAPARAAVEVARLPKDARVEIEAVAVI